MAYLRQCLYELRAASGLAPFEVPSPEPRLAQPAAVRPAYGGTPGSFMLFARVKLI